MLQIVDAQWKDHLYSLDHLKEGIGLRGYGQRDPLIEYKKESFALFQAMKERVDEEIVRYLWWLRPILNEEAADRQAPGGRAAPPPLILNDPGGGVRVGARRRAGAGAAGEPVRAVSAAAAAAAAAARRRRRCAAEDGSARRAEGRPQRPVPVRQREEVQEMPRSRRLTRNHQSPVTTRHARPTFVGLLFI